MLDDDCEDILYNGSGHKEDKKARRVAGSPSTQNDLGLVAISPTLCVAQWRASSKFLGRARITMG